MPCGLRRGECSLEIGLLVIVVGVVVVSVEATLPFPIFEKQNVNKNPGKISLVKK